MAKPPAPAWMPRRLRARDLEAPFTAALRRLPKVHRDDLQRRRRDLLDHTATFRGRNADRLKHYVLGGAVFFPLVVSLFWFLWHARGGLVFVAMPFLGAAYGAFVVLLRPSPWLAGMGFFLASVLLFLVDGSAPFHARLGFVWFHHVAMFALGMMVGATAE